MALVVRLFDKVKLNDNAEGIVKFIGEIKGKKGIYYGIELKKGVGKNNGKLKDYRYFRTKGNKKSGRFTQISKIIKTTKTKKSIQITVDDTINYTQLTTTAIIRYVGIPSWSNCAKTVYYGIELSEPKGDCNGTKKTTTYFTCAPNHGLYIKSDTINYNAIDKTLSASFSTHALSVDDQKTDKNSKNVISNGFDNSNALLTEISKLKDVMKFEENKFNRMNTELQDTRKQNQIAQSATYQIKNDLAIAKEELVKLTNNNNSCNDELAALKKEIEDLKKQNNTLKDTQNTMQTVLDDVNKLNKELKDELDESKKKHKVIQPDQQNNDQNVSQIELNTLKKSNKELQQQLNEYKEKLHSLKTNPANSATDDKKNDNQDDVHKIDRDKYDKLQLKYDKLFAEKNKLQERYLVAKQKISNLRGSNISDNQSVLEQELEAIKAKVLQKNKKNKKNKKQPKINDALTKFAAIDANSAGIILTEILKQWDSQFISTKSRIKYLKNFNEILKVLSKQINMDPDPNNRLDPIINTVLNKINEAKKSKDDALKKMAIDICNDQIVEMFMKRKT